jgi:translation initiation factor 2-alpha kinase 4
VSAQLKTIFQGTNFYQLASPTLAHLKEVSEFCKRFGVRTKMYVVPLWSWNEVFFSGGIMFSCVFDKRSKEIFAAGGRYDGLIKEHRPRINTHFEERHAVGFGFNWERLGQVPKPAGSGKALLRRQTAEEAQGIFTTKRVSNPQKGQRTQACFPKTEYADISRLVRRPRREFRLEPAA